MQWQQLDEQGGRRTLAVVLETGDEVIEVIRCVAQDQQLAGSHFSAIGALRHARLGFFDWRTKDYSPIVVDEQVEVLALLGDIALVDGAPRIHAHVVLGTRDGTARGGHLLEGHVRPTLEVVIVESPRHLLRRYDPETGLHLIRLTGRQR